jgi:hypothetical protein
MAEIINYITVGLIEDFNRHRKYFTQANHILCYVMKNDP